MKTFTTFVKKYQLCEAAQDRENLIKEEMSKIRNHLEKSADKHLTLSSLWELIFMRKQGYDVAFFKHYILDLLSHKKDSVRAAGRAALEHLFDDNDELITLSTQILYSHSSEGGFVSEAPLLLVASIANTGYIPIFMREILATVNSSVVSSSHYQNTLLVLIKFIKIDPNLLTSDFNLNFQGITNRLAEDSPVLSRHILTLLDLTFSIIPEDLKQTIGDKVTTVLKKLVLDHISHPYYIHHGVVSPFLQIALINFLSKFKISELNMARVKSILVYIQRRCEINSDGVKSRATLAILHETIKIISIFLAQKADPSILEDRIIDLIARYLSVRDPNLRLLGLQSFNDLLKIRDCVDRFIPYRYIIIKLIDDADINIRFEACKCVYFTSDRNNFKESLKLLLDVFNSDSDYKKKHVLIYICTLLEAFNEDQKNEINLFVKLLKALQKQKLEFKSSNPNKLKLPNLETQKYKFERFCKDFNRYLFDKSKKYTKESLLYLHEYSKSLKFINYRMETEFVLILILQKISLLENDKKSIEGITKNLFRIYQLPVYEKFPLITNCDNSKYLDKEIARTKLNILYILFHISNSVGEFLKPEIINFFKTTVKEEFQLYQRINNTSEKLKKINNQLLILNCLNQYLNLAENGKVDESLKEADNEFFEELGLEEGLIYKTSLEYAKIFRTEEFNEKVGTRKRLVTGTQLAKELRRRISHCFLYNPKAMNAQILLDISFRDNGILLMRDDLEATFIISSDYEKQYEQTIVKVAILWKHKRKDLRISFPSNRNKEAKVDGLLFDSDLKCTTDKTQIVLGGNSDSVLQLFLFKYEHFAEMPALNIQLEVEKKVENNILYLPINKLHFFYIDKNMTNQEILEKWDELECTSTFSIDSSFHFEFIVEQVERFFNICKPSGEFENFVIGNGKFLSDKFDLFFEIEKINTSKALKMVNIKCVSQDYKVIEIFRNGLCQLFKIKSK